jgi:hypothetical protein
MDTPQDMEPETDAFAGIDLSMVAADCPNWPQEIWGTNAPHSGFRSAVSFRRCDWP